MAACSGIFIVGFSVAGMILAGKGPNWRLALMAYSFYIVGFEGVAFVGGILAVGASIALPAHVLGRSDS